MEQQTTAAGNAEPDFAAFIGIDWADRKHYRSLESGKGRVERGTLDNTPEAVEAWMPELRRRFEGRPPAVALEQRKGALVVMLGKYEHAYLYPVHPRTVAKLRQAWYPSGSKDDVKDADLLLEILTKHRDHLRRLDPVCFPQIPRWFEDVSTEIVSDLLTKWPTLEDLRRARPATLEKFFRDHQCRDEETIARRLNGAFCSRPLRIFFPSR
jgi:hypothetical protein